MAGIYSAVYLSESVFIQSCKMPTILSLLLFASVLNICRTINILDIPSPPSIVVQPSKREQFFRVVTTDDDPIIPITLECEATGDPEPTYYWTKDGEPFDTALFGERIIQHRGIGTLYFSKPLATDEGIYQCFAKNYYGISLSNSISLRKSELHFFPLEKPKVVDVVEGSLLSLKCDPPKGHPKPAVFWMIQPNSGEPRSINSSRVSVDPEGGLHFSNVTKEDALDDAVYACIVSSLFRSELKVGNRRKINVIPREIKGPIFQPPVKQYVSPSKITVLEGDKLELTCIYGGTPIPTVKWYFTKKGLISRERLDKPVKIDKTFLIKSVDSDSEGSYQCVADNGVGSEQIYSITVTVESVPYWNVSPINLEAAEEENVRFECSASGKPPPKLQWLMNGEPIEKIKPNPRRIIEGNIMTISNLVKEDTAVYQCNASNVHGYVFKDFYLNILAIPPIMRESPANITYAVVGSTTTIKCLVYGVPNPKVNWKKNGQDLIGKNFQLLENGNLELVNILEEDEGNYTCQAENKFGSLEETGQLEVKDKTKIIQPPENLEVPIGQSATFHCKAEVDPTLSMTVKWFFNGEPIDYHQDPRVKQLESQSLFINTVKVSDSGIYTCYTETAIDKDSAWASLIVQSVPEPPIIIDVQCEIHVADIQWEPMGDGHAVILGYNIQYNTSFNPDIWKDSFVNIPASDTRFKVAMSPWTDYTFRVIAFNKIGSSEPSEYSKQCSTPSDVPDKHPDQVKGEGTKPDNLVISWKPMPRIEHNAPGFYYKVYWQRDDLPDAQKMIKFVKDWKQGSLVVDQQPTFRPYRIKVEAYNSKGRAKITAPEVLGYSGEDVPLEAPQNFRLIRLISATTAKFGWDAVPSSSLRGHFMGYKIRIRTSEDHPDHWREQLFPENNTQEIVNILKPFSKNVAEVVAVNGKYSGPPSHKVSFITPEGVPGPVASFSAFPLGSSALYLIWKKPVEANGVLTGYQIFYEKVNGTTLGEKIEHKPSLSNPDATRLKLSRLDPETKYRLTIQATTQIGMGEAYYIEETTGTGVPEVPDVPHFIWSRLFDDDSTIVLKVTWLPALEGHPGSYFYVQYRSKGESLWKNTTAELETDYTVVMGLERNTLYEMRVVSVDGPFETPSLIVEVETESYGVPSAQVIDSAGTAPWLIALMCAIALALLIIIIICLIKRNAGGKYPVYKKEATLGSGLDYPDGGGFHEYNKPSSNHHPLKGSRTSLNSSLAGPGSDTDSMAEYGGEGDTGKFTEDGSFIGQYGRTKNAEEESRLSTAATPLV